MPSAIPLTAASPTLYAQWHDQPLVLLLAACLGLIVLLMMAYGVRHVLFTVSRLYGHQRHPYIDIDTADWPQITVFIAAHNEER